MAEVGKESRKEKIRNLIIREIMNVQYNIIEVILVGVRRLRWFGNFKRMRSHRIPKMILVWNAEGRRKKRSLEKKDGRSKKYGQQSPNR